MNGEMGRTQRDAFVANLRKYPSAYGIRSWNVGQETSHCSTALYLYILIN
jgi:hypothetical protein